MPEASESRLLIQPGGTRHALILFHPTGGGSRIDHFVLEHGGTWERQVEDVARSTVSLIHGLDATLTPGGGLLASYHLGRSVQVSFLAPGSAEWEVERVARDVTVQTGFELNHRTSVLASGSLEDPFIELAYSQYLSDEDRTKGVYATRRFRSTADFTLEDISAGTGSMENLVLRAGQIPETGFSGSRRGPVIAFYREAGYYLAERQVDLSLLNPGQGVVRWSLPTEIFPGPVLNAHPDFREMDLEISDGILHLVADSRLEGTPAVAYYRRSVVNISGAVGFSFLSEVRENVAEGIRNRDGTRIESFDSLDLSLSPTGQLYVSWVGEDNARDRWDLYLSQRSATGTSPWKSRQVFDPPTNFAGEPSQTQVAADIFATPVLLALRNDPQTLGNVPPRLITGTRDLSIPQSSLSLPGVRPEDLLNGHLAVNERGDVAVAYEVDHVARLRLLPADGGPPTTVTLPDQASKSSPNLTGLQVAAAGPDGFAVLVSTSSTNGPQDLSPNQRVTLFLTSGGDQVRSIRLYDNTASLLTLPVTYGDFALATDAAGLSLFYSITSQGFGTIGQPAPVTTTLLARRFRLSGEEVPSYADRFAAASFGKDIRGIRAVSSHGELALVGRQGSSLVVVRDDGGRWSLSPVKTIADSFFPSSDQIDIARQGSRIVIVYSEGSTTWLANPAANGGGGWDQKRINGSSFGGRQVKARLDDNEHLSLIMRRAAGGGLIEFIRYASPVRLRGVAPDEAENLVLLQTSEIDFLAAFDSLGLPVVLAVDDSQTERTRRLFRSPLALDADGDGRNTFMEAALGSDPDQPDHREPLSVIVTRVDPDSGAIQEGTLVLERAAGNLTEEGGILRNAVARYEIQRSLDLRSFFTAGAPSSESTLDLRLDLAALGINQTVGSNRANVQQRIPFQAGSQARPGSQNFFSLKVHYDRAGRTSSRP